MTIQEVRDILNRLSPDELQEWMTDWSQMMVQTAKLEVPVSIDKQELDGLSDDKIKEFSDKELLSKASQAMGPLAILGGKNVAEVIIID